jgi:hypothetical protein
MLTSPWLASSAAIARSDRRWPVIGVAPMQPLGKGDELGVHLLGGIALRMPH